MSNSVAESAETLPIRDASLCAFPSQLVLISNHVSSFRSYARLRFMVDINMPTPKRKMLVKKRIEYHIDVRIYYIWVI